jgi:hypothetical protein
VNRAELVASMNRASSELLREKGFISFVDVLHMGRLTKEDHESWRMRRIPYLERAIRLNLSQLSHLLRALRENAFKGRLQPRKTAYVSWGKGRKQPLRFSKSGHPGIEEAYATHFVKRQQSVKDKPSRPDFDRTLPDSSKLSQDILAIRQEAKGRSATGNRASIQHFCAEQCRRLLLRARRRHL